MRAWKKAVRRCQREAAAIFACVEVKGFDAADQSLSRVATNGQPGRHTQRCAGVSRVLRSEAGPTERRAVRYGEHTNSGLDVPYPQSVVSVITN